MIRKLAAAAAVLAAFAQPLAAQDYPSKPITMVVPYNPGGALDFVARTLSQPLSEVLGQPVVVENLPGASGAIGAQSVASAAPDGYTLMMDTVTSRGINAILRKSTATFDYRNDFELAGTVGNVPFVLVVNKDLAPQTAQELVTFATTGGNELSFASTGIGSSEHLATELFHMLTGASYQNIPYTGGALAIADVVAGHVNGMIAVAPTALPFVASGDVRPLLVTMPERIAQLPDVPTSAEVGYPDLLVSSFYAVHAPAGLDPAVASKLNDAINEIVGRPEFEEAMNTRGLITLQTSHEEAQKLFTAEIDRWENVITTGGITVE